MRARLKRVKAQVRKRLIKDDVLNSKDYLKATPHQRQQLLSAYIGKVMNQAVHSINPTEYIRQPYKKAVFDIIDDEKISISRIVPTEVFKSQRAEYSLGRRIQFNRDLHRKLTADLQSTIDETLTEALKDRKVKGRTVANAVVARIDKVGMNRSKVIAATETVAAYADGALDLAEELGVKNVEAEVEFTTAGDKKVCPLCRPLEGRIYTLEEARGVIPVHPNCRCRWRPVMDKAA